jgi:hypothetical protein
LGPAVACPRPRTAWVAFGLGPGHSGSMSVTGLRFTAALARYARRFHQVAGTGHHVASPLGAWLMRARRRGLPLSCWPAAPGGARCRSGVGRKRASRRRPDRLLACGAAAPGRHRRDARPGGIGSWARRHTLGLIDRFPVRDRRTLIWLLATAVAARVSWQRPFDLAPASALSSASRWATTLTRVLRTPQGLPTGRVPGHDQFIATWDACHPLVRTCSSSGGSRSAGWLPRWLAMAEPAY